MAEKQTIWQQLDALNKSNAAAKQQAAAAARKKMKPKKKKKPGFLSSIFGARKDVATQPNRIDKTVRKALGK